MSPRDHLCYFALAILYCVDGLIADSHLVFDIKTMAISALA
jgi:hypothetical protein